MRLAEVSPGRDVRILAVGEGTDAGPRMREIGLAPGAIVTVLQRAAFGAVVVALGASSLALDRDTARRMEVGEA